MTREVAAIAALVPEVQEKLPGLYIPHPQSDLEQGRLRLFDAITTFFYQASQHQPLVLIFDNLHWADKSSLLLLEFMAEELATARLLLLGTYRDTELLRGHPLQQALGELIKLPHFQRLSLVGLTEHDVADYIGHSCNASPPPALVHEIHSRTAGRPSNWHAASVKRVRSGRSIWLPRASGSWDSRKRQVITPRRCYSTLSVCIIAVC
jgi:predicted ATPase